MGHRLCGLAANRLTVSGLTVKRRSLSGGLKQFMNYGSKLNGPILDRNVNVSIFVAVNISIYE